jgi:hypothetical protein
VNVLYGLRLCREKQERKSDPNVEYVDMDDFRPGGKYGPKNVDSANVPVNPSTNIQSTELAKASAVLAEATQV